MSRMLRASISAALLAVTIVASTPHSHAQAPALTLGLTVNDPALVPGDTLTVGISVDNPAGGPLADIFFLIVLPDGSTVVSAGPGVGARFGTLADLRSLVPVVRGLSLANAFPYAADSFFAYRFAGGEPQGTYRIMFAALRTGALDNGSLDAGEVLAFTSRDVIVSASPVVVDTSRTVTTTVGAGGGTVQTTAADGTSYVLTLPAGAVETPTAISIAPVVSFEGLPGPFVAGIRGGPNGLQLSPPATLRITLPPAFRSSAFGVRGVLTDDSGQQRDFLPATLAGNVVTMTVNHFSVAAIEVLLDFDDLACSTALGPLPAEQATACAAIDPLADAEAVRLAQQGGDIGQAFKNAMVPILGSWLASGLLPRLDAAGVPVPGRPMALAQDVAGEWAAWVSMYRILFGLDDRNNATAGRPLGATIDLAQLKLRLALVAAMNAVNIQCLAQKADVALWLYDVAVEVPSLWNRQFAEPPATPPFDLTFCLSIRIDAAPPPVLVPGVSIRMPIAVRLVFIDGVELPGRPAAVSIAATNGTRVEPAGGVVTLPIAGNISLEPGAATSAITITAALTRVPDAPPLDDLLPSRTRTFQAGTDTSVSVSGTFLRTRVFATGQGAPPEDLKTDDTFASGATVNGSLPTSSYPSGSADQYAMSGTARITRSHSSGSGSLAVSASGDLSLTLSRQGAPNFNSFTGAQADDAWCVTLARPFILTPSSNGDVLDFEIRRSTTTFDLLTSGPVGLSSGTWCLTFDAGIARSFVLGTGFSGKTSGAFSYSVTLTPVP